MNSLLDPSNSVDSVPFEEVKLVLALSWQKGRWTGSDGGVGGYGEVLALMADADRYEYPDPMACSKNLVHDMADRFPLIAATDESVLMMQQLSSCILEADAYEKVDEVRRKCAGMVLKAMGFIESGL